MATITEDYVSFETAKLLKQKGFDIGVRYYYQKIDDDITYHVGDFRNWNVYDMWYSMPTLQMAMKWLREVHNIYITILLLEKEEGDYGYTIEDINDRKYLETSKNNSYNTHKEACESAIKYCLENLI